MLFIAVLSWNAPLGIVIIFPFITTQSLNFVCVRPEPGLLAKPIKSLGLAIVAELVQLTSA
jgi:hypothetical protein